MYNNCYPILLKCTWVYYIWNKVLLAMFNFGRFLLDCKERKYIFNLNRNLVNRFKLFMDIRYIEVWREHPRPIWSIVRARVLRNIDNWHHQPPGTRPSRHSSLSIVTESGVTFDWQYVLQPPSAQGWRCKDSSIPQTFTRIVFPCF